MRILFNLIDRLLHRYARALQLNVKDRHAVDQKHQIPAAVLQHLLMPWEQRLLHNLIAALPGSNFHAVINFQADLLAVVKFISRIFTDQRYCLAIDKTIQGERCAQCPDLLQELVHLLRNKRAVIQTVDITIVLKENVGPVLDQILLRGFIDYILLPAITL